MIRYYLSWNVSMLSMALSDSNLWCRLTNYDRTKKRLCLAAGVSMGMFAQCLKEGVCNISTEKYRLRRYLPRRYSVTSRLNQLDATIDGCLPRHGCDASALKGKGAFYVQSKEPLLQSVSYDGQLWDVRALTLKLISGTKLSLILIDSWATMKTYYIENDLHKTVREERI